MINDYMIQTRDNNNRWGSADWRKTLTDARALADEQAAKSLFGKARVLYGSKDGFKVIYRASISAEQIESNRKQFQEVLNLWRKQGT